MEGESDGKKGITVINNERHTLMDYDNNDFQGHNLHLAGEESSKLSPVLRPYAVPNYDFNESLQDHLSFDGSLVENEVFLGISSQEGDQWIEELSRGSSEIEFSSSAAESCRRNNVWSEATSSESVEMLLNSVGQEESVIGKTIIKESDAGGQLGKLTTEMDPNSNQDDKEEDFPNGWNESPAVADITNVVCASKGQNDDVVDESGKLTEELETSSKQDDKIEDATQSQPVLPPGDFPNWWNECAVADLTSIECSSEGQKDAGSGSELGKLTKEMETISKQDDRVEDATHIQPALGPDDFPNGSNGSAVADHINVDCTSEVQKEDVSDESDKLTMQIETNSKQDDKVKDVIHSQAALLPVNFLGWNEIAVADFTTVECTSEGKKDDISSELGKLTKEMEPNLNQDDKVEDTSDSQPKIPPDDFSNGWNESAAVPDLANVECTSEGPKDVGSELGKLTEKMETDLKQDHEVEDASHSQPSLPPYDFPNGWTESAAMADITNVECTSEGQKDDSHVNERSGKVDSNVFSGVIVSEEGNVGTGGKCDDASLMEIDNSVDESLVDNVEVPHFIASRPESLEHNVESNTATFELSGLSKNEERDLQIAGGHENNLGPVEPSQHCDSEAAVCTENPEFCKQFQDSLHEDSPVLCLGVGSPKGREAIEVGNIGSGNSACPEEMGSVEEKEKDLSQGSLNEASPVVCLGDGSPKGQEAIEVGNIEAGNSSCPELEMGSVEEKEKDLSVENGSPRVHKEDFIANEGHTSSPMLGESIDEGKNDLSFEQGGAQSGEQDAAPFYETGNAELPKDSDEYGEGNITIAQGSEFDSSTMNETESKVGNDSNLSSCDTRKGLPLLSGTDAISDVASDNHGQTSPVLEVITVDTHEKEEMYTKIHGDASNLGLKESLQVTTDTEPVLEVPVSEVASHNHGQNTTILGEIGEKQKMDTEANRHASLSGQKASVQVAAIDPEPIFHEGPVSEVASDKHEQKSTILGEIDEKEKMDTEEDGDTITSGVKESLQVASDPEHVPEAPASEIASHILEQKSTVMGEISMDIEEKEGAGTELHKDASMSGLKESVQVAVDPELVIEGPVPEAVVESMTVEICNAASQSDQAAALEEAGQEELSNKLEVHPVISSSTAEQVECSTEAAAAGCENYKETSLETNAEVALVEEVPDAVVLSNKNAVTAEAIWISMVEPSCEGDQELTMLSGTQTTVQIGPSTEVDSSDNHQDCVTEDAGNSGNNLGKGKNESTTAISCTELLPSEKEQQAGIKVSTVDNNVQQSEATFDADWKVVKSLSKEEGIFAFEGSPFVGLSEGEASKGFQSSPRAQVHKISTDVEGSALTSGPTRLDLKAVLEISLGSPQAPIEGTSQAGAKGTTKRKPRRSGKAAARENANKGNNHVKETITPGRRQSKRKDKSTTFMGSPATGQLLQFEQLKPCEKSGSLPIPTSSVPDLNTSVPPAAFYQQQPFTDLQQVQLRAQIFVYGSLIQDSIPDEACMVSAFGPSDGGGSVWEPSYRTCVERVNSQKSHASNPETTPVQSRSGIKAPDQAVKRNKSKDISSPSGRASSKGILSPVVNHVAPLSSPLWNVSTPSDRLQSTGMPRGPLIDYHQPLSPLHSYQPPGIRNFVGQSPSWLSQTTYPPGPWVASPQTSTFDTNPRFSLFPNTEPVKLTPAKVSTSLTPPTTKQASLLAVAHGSEGPSVSSGTNSQSDVKNELVLSAKHSADPKPRKRKKTPVTDAQTAQTTLPALTQAAAVCSPGVPNHLPGKAHVPKVDGPKSVLAPTAVASNLFSTSVAVTTPDRLPSSTSNSGKIIEAVVDQNVEKSNISEETLNTVEEAKLQAEAAAAQAAAAVSRCHEVWSQLSNQRNSDLMPNDESKLTSAAVAIAAAASIAKAAAAAAKIASNVALQAKLMADEVHLTQSSGISVSNVSNGSRNGTPSSVIAVAREAARKRVEAASAASKHAENLDAIVKAAELAEQAVAQAGQIVSIGDPLPLSKLVVLGPMGNWKNSQLSSEEAVKSVEAGSDQPMTISVELGNVSAERSKVGPPSVVEEPNESGITVRRLEKDSSRARRGHRASKLPKAIDLVPELEAGSGSASVIAEDAQTSASGPLIENAMKEGGLVEVFKDGGNYKGAWYSANILNLKGGKAFVCYTDLQADKGSGKLKEWVPIEGDGINAPIMRIPHPMTSTRSDGIRKRRRAAVMEYTWSVEDRVDAWMEDCWREGVVKEKNKNDETTFTIQFAALGETSAVRAWHLRPTLTWQDGKWIEWSSARRHSPSQGDTPREKRMKLGNPAIEAATSNPPAPVESTKKQEEPRLQLPLSASEREFNVGKKTTRRQESSKVDAHRTMTRTGLQQKEGSSRVVFGVPIPGKKRKFMDQFDSDHTTNNKKNMKTSSSESVKFARYLMPQGSSGSGSRGWKNDTATISDAAKEKHNLGFGEDNKSKTLRSGKPPSVSSSKSLLPQKNNFLTSAKSVARDAAISNEENDTGRANVMEFGSVSNSQTDKSQGPTSTQVASKKVVPSKPKSERLNKGNLAPPSGRLGRKVEIQEKSIPEVVELPRRSVRKIQPTSRLLEGLQSSFTTISKMPSVPQSHRSQHRHNFKGNT